MICYKDRSFCSMSYPGTKDRCTQTKCYRYFSDEERANARKWWESDQAPIALSPFHEQCGEYTTVKD